MKLKPLHDYVVVQGITKEEKTKSGILLPDTIDKERPEQGKVISVGPGRTMDNGQLSSMSVKVGDQVMFKKYHPEEFKLDGEEFLVIRESEIIAIVE